MSDRVTWPMCVYVISSATHHTFLLETMFHAYVLMSCLLMSWFERTRVVILTFWGDEYIFLYYMFLRMIANGSLVDLKVEVNWICLIMHVSNWKSSQTGYGGILDTFGWKVTFSSFTYQLGSRLVQMFSCNYITSQSNFIFLAVFSLSYFIFYLFLLGSMSNQNSSTRSALSPKSHCNFRRLIHWSGSKTTGERKYQILY